MNIRTAELDDLNEIYSIEKKVFNLDTEEVILNGL